MKDNHFKNFILIGIILTVVSLIYPFLVNYFFDDWTKSGTFGDTFGALNALFSGLAIAGLITTILIQKNELKYQKEELTLQRNEMKETRKEFLLNRSTNLIYRQLERFEKSINELTIKFEANTYTGNSAIFLLDKFNKVRTLDELADETLIQKRKEENAYVSKVYIKNKDELNKFSHNAYNSVEVLQNIIYNSTLEIEELNELKNLFFENIGFINLGVIENVLNLSKEQTEIFEIEDYVKLDIGVGEMYFSEIFFKSIIAFSKLRLTEENFEENKKKWKSRKGMNY